jgi:hypothetical protein
LRLLELLKQPEGKTLEFKRDLSSPDGVLRSIVAFANTAGGILLIGVEDKSRHVRGVKDPLATEERLANLVSDNIMPRLAPELKFFPGAARMCLRYSCFQARRDRTFSELRVWTIAPTCVWVRLTGVRIAR